MKYAFSFRRMLKIFAVASLTTIILLPTALSFSVVQSALFSIINKKYGYEISCQSASFGWLSGVHIEDIKIQSEEFPNLFSVHEFTSEKPLYSYCTSPKNLGVISIQGFELVLSNEKSVTKQPNSKSTTKSTSTKASRKQRETNTLPPPLPLDQGSITQKKHIEFALPDISVDIHCKQGKIFVGQSGGYFSTLEDISGIIDLSQTPASLLINIDGTISALGRADNTPFSIDAQLRGKELFQDLIGTISAEIREIPTLIFEGLASIFFKEYIPFIEPILGKNSSISLHGKIEAQTIDLISNITSDNLKSSCTVTVTPEEIRCNRGKVVEINLNETLFKNIIKFSGATSAISLKNQVQFDLAVTEPILFSLKSHTWDSESKITFSHQPAIIIDRQDSASLSMQYGCTLSTKPSGETFFFSAKTGELQSSSSPVIMTIDATSTIRENGSFSRDCSLDLAVSGPIFQLISNEFQIPTNTLFGPKLTSNVHIDSQIENGTLVSYTGQYDAAFENGQKSGTFSGDSNHLDFKNGTSNVFIPFIKLLQASGQKISEYSCMPQEGVTITGNLPSATIFFQNDLKNSFLKSSLDCTLDLFCQPIAHDDFSLGQQTEPTVSLSIKKEKNSQLATIISQINALVETKSASIQKMVGQKLPIVLHGEASISPYDDNLKLTVDTLDLSIAQASFLHVQDLEASFSSKEPLLLLSIPHPISWKAAIMGIDGIPYCTKESKILIESTIFTKTPIAFSKEQTLSSGTVDILSQCTVGSEKLLEATIPMNIDLVTRYVHGSFLLKEGLKKSQDRLGRVSAIYTAQLPKELSFQKCIEEALFDFQLSSVPFMIQDLSPIFSKPSLSRLEKVFGKSVKKCDLQASFKGIHSRDNKLDSTIITDTLTLTSHIESQNGSVVSSGNKPIFIVQARLTPDIVRAMYPSSPFDIRCEANSSCTFSIHNVTIPIEQISSASWSNFHEVLQNTRADFSWKSDEFDLLSTTSKSTRSFSIPSLSMEGTCIGKTGEIKSSIQSGKSSTSKSPIIDGNILLALPLEIPFTETDQFIQKSRCTASLSLKNLDPRLLSTLSGDEEKVIKELLGSDAAFHLTVSLSQGLNGSLDTLFEADNCKFICSGTVRNGVFVPSKSIEATLQVTQRAGEKFLRDLNPILATAISAEKPLTLAIPADGVYIPIFPFSIDAIVIPKGVVSFEKIRVKNDGLLRTILGFLGAKGISKKNEMELWSTPVYFSFKNGIITCNRADFLVEQAVHMALWGTVNFPKDHLAMTIFIPNSALKAIGVKAISSSGLSVPISGKISDPKVDIARVSAKITALGLRSSSFNPATQIISGLIEVGASLGEEDPGVPAPTTSPFPWEKRR